MTLYRSHQLTDQSVCSHPLLASFQCGSAARFQYCPDTPFVLALFQVLPRAWRHWRAHCVRVLLLYLVIHLKIYEWDWIFHCCQWTFLLVLAFPFIYFIWHWCMKALASLYHLPFEFPCVSFIVWRKAYIFLLYLLWYDPCGESCHNLLSRHLSLPTCYRTRTQSDTWRMPSPSWKYLGSYRG